MAVAQTRSTGDGARALAAQGPAADDAGPSGATPVLFDAVLTPSRSLTPRAARNLLLAAGSVSFVLGLSFIGAGWWPVAGYFALDVLLLWWAFRASFRSGRLVERLRLTVDALTIARIQPNGSATEWAFHPAWLRVEMDDPPEHDSQLVLASHGRRLAVGSFLSPAERLEVADALRAAVRTAASMVQPQPAEQALPAACDVQ